jgi:SAM-dependent methyltransferase
MDLKEEQILGEDILGHWYYQSKARFLLRVINTETDSRILDIGAGSGFFSRWLLTNTAVREATCVDIGYQQNHEEAVGEKTMWFCARVDKSNADLVLLMDVLEHVDDDVELLRHYVNKVPDGATFVITVPAFQFLWSSHDVFLQHKRRYTLKSLADVLQAAGLRIEKLNYCFGLIFPVACVMRLGDKFFGPGKDASRSSLKKHSKPVNAFLKMLCALELPLVRFNRVAGLSVICKCKKVEAEL